MDSGELALQLNTLLRMKLARATFIAVTDQDKLVHPEAQISFDY